MTKIKLQKQVKSKFYSFLNLVSSVVLNSAFLCIWLAIQFAVAYLISLLPTDAINEYLILTFRTIFAGSTLIPIIINLCRDILILGIQAYSDVRDSWRANHSNGNLSESLV